MTELMGAILFALLAGVLFTTGVPLGGVSAIGVALIFGGSKLSKEG